MNYRIRYTDHNGETFEHQADELQAAKRIAIHKMLEGFTTRIYDLLTVQPNIPIHTYNAEYFHSEYQGI